MTLLTVKQVAGMLQLSVSKIYELVSQGKLPVYRIGGAVRIGMEDLQGYLSECREVKQEPAPRPPVKLKHLVLRNRA